MKRALSYEERVELAKKLISQNVPTRKILPKVNFTPNKLFELRKEIYGHTTDSKSTQAYRLLEQYEITKYHDENALLEIALELDITSEQMLKYYDEYLALKRHDAIRALHKKDEGELQSLLDLQKMLSDKQIPREDYPNVIEAIKTVGTIERQQIELNHGIRTAQMNFIKWDNKVKDSYTTSESLDVQIQNKTQQLADLHREYKEINERNQRFRSLFEFAIKGDLAPLIVGFVNERISFDRETLLGFVEYIVPSIIAALQWDRDLTGRLSTGCYTDWDANYFMVRIKNEVDTFLDSWLQSPTKWRAINPGSFPLDI